MTEIQVKNQPKKTQPTSTKPSANKTDVDNKNDQLIKKLKKQNIKVFELKFNFAEILNKGFVYLIIFILFLPFLLRLSGSDREKVSLSQLVDDVRQQKVESIMVVQDELQAKYKDDKKEKVALKESNANISEIFKNEGLDLNKAQVEVSNASGWRLFFELVINFLPVLLMIGFFFFLYRQSRGAQDGIMGIGRSKAKIFIKGKQNKSFEDVGGMDEAKKELEEIVDFLKNPKKYQKMGARTPKGVLLVGPAGTGKTLLARAVAGEAGVQFLSIAGSEFMEMLVGVGASRARDLFLTAKKLAPSIIFIDEIDAIGRIRGFGSMGGHDEREQTLNQILVEMDGFTQSDNVIVMAATNRGDMLDPALIRPGRFDRRVMVNLPDLEERKYIISIHAKDKPVAKAVDWSKVAKRTVGFSGEDIENMLNEAAIAVARTDRTEITLADIDEAAMKVKLGPSKRRLQDPLERKMTAYHEAGHAVISHILPNADPVQRISIVSRGHALGYTFTPPERDKLQTTKSELLDEISVLLAGRATEQLVFSEQTAGASNDLERATKIARAMVTELGMSDLGPMNFAPQYETGSFQKGLIEPLKISAKLQEQVDGAVKSIIDAQLKATTTLLKAHRASLNTVAERLIEVETLDGEEFTKLMLVRKS